MEIAERTGIGQVYSDGLLFFLIMSEIVKYWKFAENWIELDSLVDSSFIEKFYCNPFFFTVNNIRKSKSIIVNKSTAFESMEMNSVIIRRNTSGHFPHQMQ